MFSFKSSLKKDDSDEKQEEEDSFEDYGQQEYNSDG
jgi:hypothetical protein